MSQTSQSVPSNSDHGQGSIADELKRESDRLRRLAEELKQREELQAEMEANYPLFKQIVYTMLREQFEREIPPLPDKDLEALAIEEDARPLDVLLGRLSKMKEER